MPLPIVVQRQAPLMEPRRQNDAGAALSRYCTSNQQAVVAELVRLGSAQEVCSIRLRYQLNVLIE
jgi:hypothetical protein